MPKKSLIPSVSDDKELRLTEDQKKILQKACCEGANLIIRGKAGSGKSTITRLLIENFRALRKRVAVTASTGIAALNIGGKTIHSWLGTGLANNVEDLHRMSKIKPPKRVSVLIVDEAFMLDGAYYDMIRALYISKGKKFPQIILVGDEKQLPPINYRYSVEQSAFYKHGKFEEFELKEVLRQTDKEFIHHLTNIRDHIVNDETLEYFNARTRPTTDQTPHEAVCLYPLNKMVNKKNQEELAKLTTPLRTFYPNIIKNPKMCDKLLRQLLVETPLKIRSGARVIITKNIAAKQVVNGDVGTVKGIYNNFFSVELDRGGHVKIEREEYVLKNRDDFIVAHFEHFPVKLAWALSIHKVQGLTLDNITLDPRGVFADGQLYTALSRVRTIEGLTLLNPIEWTMV